MMQDRANDAATGKGAAAVCRLLRTKTAFGSAGGGSAWESGASTTAAYWCLATMQAAGPDDGFAHPHSCRPGRACFAPPRD